MAVQNLPPLGWPHTEAEKARSKAAPGEELPQVPVGPDGLPVSIYDDPKASNTRRGCGCGVGVAVLIILVVLAVAGAVAVMLVGESTDEPVTDAGDSFVTDHPTWTVETGDVFDTDSGTVRLVTWDPDREIGRLVFMEPRDEEGWNEFPLIVALTGDMVAEEALLDAFSEAWRDVDWTYIRDADVIDRTTDPETWLVSYRVWGSDTGEWTGVLETPALRFAGTGAWWVAGAGETADVAPGTDASATLEP